MKEITISITDQNYAALQEVARQSGMTIEREASGAITRGMLNESRLSFQWWHDHPCDGGQGAGMMTCPPVP